VKGLQRLAAQLDAPPPKEPYCSPCLSAWYAGRSAEGMGLRIYHAACEAVLTAIYQTRGPSYAVES
jgi:hypothetical protein